MPTYISKDGMWYAAKEKVALQNITGKVKVVNGVEVLPGEPYIYEGPDRAALFELYKAGVETFGIDFHNDPELISRVRQLGYKTVDAYAKVMGYDKKKIEEAFIKNASVIQKHELPKRVADLDLMGGGKDFSGQGKDKKGGFGTPKELE
jgi:hypothetical protein